MGDLASGSGTTYLETLTDFRTNAGHLSRMMERRIAQRLGGEAAGGSLPYDVETPDGRRFEIRGFTRKLNFAPSSKIGSSRSVADGDVVEKLRLIDGYVVYDATKFPDVPCWLIPAETVAKWLATGELAASGSLSRARVAALLTAERQSAPAELVRSVADISSAPRLPQWRLTLSAALRDPPPGLEAEQEVLVGRTDADIAAALRDLRAASSSFGLGEVYSPDLEQRLLSASELIAQTLLDGEHRRPPERFADDPLYFFHAIHGDELFVSTCFYDDPLDVLREYGAARARGDEEIATVLLRSFAEALTSGSVFTSSSRATRIGWHVDDAW